MCRTVLFGIGKKTCGSLIYSYVLIWTWNVELLSLLQHKDGLEQAKKEIIRI